MVDLVSTSVFCVPGDRETARDEAIWFLDYVLGQAPPIDRNRLLTHEAFDENGLLVYYAAEITASVTDQAAYLAWCDQLHGGAGSVCEFDLCDLDTALALRALSCPAHELAKLAKEELQRQFEEQQKVNLRFSHANVAYHEQQRRKNLG